MTSLTSDSSKQRLAKGVKRGSVVFQVGALVAHLFCCGLPALAAVASLVGAAGLTLLPVWAEQFFHQYETQIFVFSVVLVALSVASHFWSQQVAANCEDDHCHDHSHTPAHAHGLNSWRRWPWLLILAFAVLALNAYLTFGIEHNHAYAEPLSAREQIEARRQGG